ncbi:hypothetical protein RI367_006921 [Sorochytrium milnesiophthora]
MSDAGSDADQTEQVPSIGTYDGERSATGERHGQGTATFPNGDTYHGMYYNGRRHGHGVYSWKKPRARYIGEYVDNWRHGRGMMCYPDGGRYQGEFVAGKRHGYGVYVYPNADVYAGEWVQNKKHGQGVYTHINGTKQKGNFVEGYLQGAGSVIHADHTIRGTFATIHEPLPTDATANDAGSDAPLSSDHATAAAAAGAPTKKGKIIGSALTVPFEIAFHAPASAFMSQRDKTPAVASAADGPGKGASSDVSPDGAFHTVTSYSLDVVGMAPEPTNGDDNA